MFLTPASHIHVPYACTPHIQSRYTSQLQIIYSLISKCSEWQTTMIMMFVIGTSSSSSCGSNSNTNTSNFTDRIICLCVTVCAVCMYGWNWNKHCCIIETLRDRCKTNYIPLLKRMDTQHLLYRTNIFDHVLWAERERECIQDSNLAMSHLSL